MSPSVWVHRAWIRAVVWLRHSKTAGPLSLAVLVGAGAGLGAVAFRFMVATTHNTFFGAAEHWLSLLGPFRYAIVPAIGGLLVGLIVRFIAPEAQGPGVAHVMMAVVQRRSRIRPHVSLAKSIASALCIGTGGSAGREGPIVQIASSLGSTLGQLFRQPEPRLRLLLGCGAAAGTAATFNVPLAGAMFALEVILRDFGVRSFGLVIVSSATATVVARATLGDAPAFPVPPYKLVSPAELPLYFLLGLLAALVGTAFVKVLYAAEDVARALRMPSWLKPAAAGLLVGLIGVTFPEVMGVGYATTEAALWQRLDVALCATLIVVKLLATSLTIGSGSSGGVFGPSLFIGAMLGASFGAGAHHLFPHATASSGAYALVGMGALFAGAARAPVTSVLMLFEMTGDYRIIIPLMCAVVTSALVSERLSKDDIYTTRLRRHGIDVEGGLPGDPLDTVTVAQGMTTELDVVPTSMGLHELSELFTETGHHGFPVVDDEGLLFGVVTLSDLAGAADHGSEGMTVADIATTHPIVCYPHQTLREALRKVGELNLGRLPVVDRVDRARLVGILRRHDIIRAYTRAATGLPIDQERRAGQK